MKKQQLAFVIILGMLYSCAGNREFIDKPIVFDDERTQMSLQYLRDRYGLEQQQPTIIPKIVVVHHTVIPTFTKTFETFNKIGLAGSRSDIQGAGSLNVSAHFLVDRDGTTYRLLPETTMARHVIGLNHCAIGIENVGGTEDLPLTKAQLRSNIRLIKYLKDKYPIDYLIGHHEYTNFEGHELWLEKDTAYRTIKDDPGKQFMGKVRRAVKKLNFKPLPKT